MENLNVSKYQYYEDVNPALINHIPSKVEILDVGCGYAALWERINNKENYVVGLEVNSSAIKVAKERLDKVYQVDITDKKQVQDVLEDKKFDIIIFADVLEHLYDPFTILQDYKSFCWEECGPPCFRQTVLESKKHEDQETDPVF